jgi:hypothetical protein
MTPEGPIHSSNSRRFMSVMGGNRGRLHSRRGPDDRGGCGFGDIGSAIGAANAAAAVPTTGFLAAAADEVSVQIAAVFGAHAQGYQALGAQAAAFHDAFGPHLGRGRGVLRGRRSRQRIAAAGHRGRRTRGDQRAHPGVIRAAADRDGTNGGGGLLIGGGGAGSAGADGTAGSAGFAGLAGTPG